MFVVYTTGVWWDKVGQKNSSQTWPVDDPPVVEAKEDDYSITIGGVTYWVVGINIADPHPWARAGFLGQA